MALLFRGERGRIVSRQTLQRRAARKPLLRCTWNMLRTDQEPHTLFTPWLQGTQTPPALQEKAGTQGRMQPRG